MMSLLLSLSTGLPEAGGRSTAARFMLHGTTYAGLAEGRFSSASESILSSTCGRRRKALAESCTWRGRSSKAGSALAATFVACAVGESSCVSLF